LYRLEVFHAGQRAATASVLLDRASDVLAAIPGLLAEHKDCDRVVVYGGNVRLFAVDCAGNTLPMD
jgi:hypothetical protein